MKKTRAFTLIELLTVIAILGALLALVMPGLSQVREEARMTVCASNQRGIGHAFFLYARTDPAAFPAVAQVYPNATGNMQIFNPNDRTMQPSTTGIPSPTVDLWTVVRANYCMSKQFICPSTTDAPDPANDTRLYFDFLAAGNLSYAYQYQHDPNRKIIGTHSDPTFPVLADANPYIKGGVTAHQLDDRRSAWRGNSTNHPNRAGENILFQDGHVVFERAPDVGLPGHVAGVLSSRGRDNCYTTHNQSNPVDPGTAKPMATPGGSPGPCNLGDKSDACLVP
ncbi:MAG: type II secretion system protein [Planctomycetota bacterium]